MFNTNSNIYVAGHTGLLGSAVLKVLKKNQYKNIIIKTHTQLDLSDRAQVEDFFSKNKIDYIFLCAGKVGGIISNITSPASYLYSNLSIQTNIFDMVIKYDIKNIIFYGSSCTYPKLCPQPMKESNWLNGCIEETSMGYAAAKIAGIIACKSYNIEYNTNKFICVIPNSIYGPNDNFDLENSHVFSALIRRFHEAKQNNDSSITLWGSGTPRREFIYSEDVADASIFLMKNVTNLKNRHYNLGTSKDFSIKELANCISNIIGFKGEILWDTNKPDGTPKKLLDSSDFLSLGWKPKTSFEKGLKLTYNWYKNNKDAIR